MAGHSNSNERYSLIANRTTVSMGKPSIGNPIPEKYKKRDEDQKKEQAKGKRTKQYELYRR